MNKSSPDPQQLFQRAVQHFQRNEREPAAEVCRSLLARFPDFVDALHMLALLDEEAGRVDAALAGIRRAIELRPQDPTLCNNLGEIFRRQQQYNDSMHWYRRAMQLAPAFPEPHYNLAIVLKELHRIEDAIAAFRRATQLRSGYAKAHYNLGNLLREEGRVKTAVIEYQKALEARPDWSDAHLNIANTYLELGEPDRAIVHYREVQKLDVTNEEIDVSLGHALMALGRVSEAKTAYQRDVQRRPERWLARLRTDALCEVICPSVEFIDDYQTHLAHTVELASQQELQIDMAELHASGAEPPMALAYHGRDVLPLMQRYTHLMAGKIPAVECLPGSGKPRLGIVCTHGHEGVFARCWGGIAERLSRQRMDVKIVCSRAGANVLRTMLRIDPAEYFVLPEKLDQAAELLREARFDALHYWEIGTDSTNYFLPYFRPAPMQSSCWGWPITSANPGVDYYLSSCHLELPEGASHYTESLVLLEALPTYYERPELPPVLQNRGHFAFSEQEHLYLCTQNMRKYHPEFDPILADILRSDPRGRLLVIADAQPSISEQLLRRFRSTLPDVVDRVQVLPRFERPEYLNVLALADVALDTLHYGGGANTVYDATSVGTPMVTLPGPFHRGRWTTAVATLLGVTETIANSPADYAQRAVRIASQSDLRRTLHKRLLETGVFLFADTNAVREHEEFFLRSIAERRAK